MAMSRRSAAQLLEELDALSTFQTVVLAVTLGLPIVLADLVAGPEVSFSIFYVAPVAIIAWRLGRTAALVAAALAAGAWYAAELLNGRSYSQIVIPLWNSLVRLGFFAIIALLLGSLRTSLRQLDHEARMDPLTGLLNRRGFVERADIELIRAARSQRRLTIAYFDIDGFKQLNDTVGHAAGDEVLREVGLISRDQLRRIDVVARMGGDEFVVLLPDTAVAEAREIIGRLRRALTRVSDHRGVGFSFGVVVFDPPPTDIDAAVRRADELMYRVKATDRGSVRYESAELDLRAPTMSVGANSVG